MEDTVELIMPFITAVAVSLPRILVALFLVPLFSLKLLKGMLRYSIVIAIALPVGASLVTEVGQRDLNPLMLGIIMLKESMVGFVIGYLLAMPFWIFQSVGVMIDNQRGALSGGYFNPGAGPDSSMMADLLVKVLVMLLITMGAFPALFSVLIETYTLWPVLDWTPQFSVDGMDVLIQKFGQLVYKFVLYSGPIVLVLLLIEAGFAILGTYCPQLQVYFMAMPAKSLVALMVLVMYCGTLWYLGGADLLEYHDLRVQLPQIFIPVTQ